MAPAWVDEQQQEQEEGQQEEQEEGAASSSAASSAASATFFRSNAAIFWALVSTSDGILVFGEERQSTSESGPISICTSIN